ncbi:MAG: hypothetical protein MI867_22215, partial [Pseudomonadales bacterium]|nr:hypothetical protein [Pseudomonadales bacterium]
FCNVPHRRCKEILVASSSNRASNDAQAILVGSADNQSNPILIGQRWHSPAGAFPSGTQWGFTMKCERLNETDIGNIPVACYVNDIEIDADDTFTYNGTFYHCEVKESGKLSLSFKPVCEAELDDCDSAQ